MAALTGNRTRRTWNMQCKAWCMRRSSLILILFSCQFDCVTRKQIPLTTISNEMKNCGQGSDTQTVNTKHFVRFLWFVPWSQRFFLIFIRFRKIFRLSRHLVVSFAGVFWDVTQRSRLSYLKRKKIKKNLIYWVNGPSQNRIVMVSVNTSQKPSIVSVAIFPAVAWKVILSSPALSYKSSSERRSDKRLRVGDDWHFTLSFRYFIKCHYDSQSVHAEGSLVTLHVSSMENTDNHWNVMIFLKINI